MILVRELLRTILMPKLSKPLNIEIIIKYKSCIKTIELELNPILFNNF